MSSEIIISTPANHIDSGFLFHLSALFILSRMKCIGYNPILVANLIMMVSVRKLWVLERTFQIEGGILVAP